ncbi:MAG: hypothetical protein QOG13_3062 [Sphingomonadales bacterium]|jgi:uncharacterized membrane protein|nr:hypothetical protein [Sphingomonadales bacterium]
MEGAFILLVFVIVVLPVITFVSLLVLRARLNERLGKIEARLERLTGGGRPERESAPPEPIAEPVAAVPEEPAAVAAPAAAQEIRIELDGILEEEAARSESLGELFERLVAGRLLIWLGGIALVLAAVFLIRHSIEIGLMTPSARMMGAAVLGLLCIGAGEYARAGRLFSEDPRIAQTFVGAGLAILYATAYGSHALYDLLDDAETSAAMVAVTAAALGLSLRHGPPTAMMGLVGGFLTPLLVGDPEAGAVPLLAYLGLLDLALFAIAWRRGWTWLAAAGVLLSFVWTGYLLSRPPEDALAAGVFVVLLGIAAALARPGEGRQLSLIQPLAIAAVQLALLVARTDLGPQAWALFGALSAASLALALLRAEYRLAPAAALGLALLLLLAKASSFKDPFVAEAAIGITLLFGVAGLALVLRRDRPLWTGIAAFGLAGPALILRGLRPEMLDRPLWGALMAALALGPVVLVWANRRRASPEPPADLCLLLAGAAAVLLAGAAVWDLASDDLVAAGWLAIAVAAALAARRLGDLALASVALLAALAGAARAAVMVPELWAATMAGLAGVPVLAADLPGAMAALYALALPALLLAALRLALPPLPYRTRRALPAAAALFAVAAAYVWFKQAFGLADEADFVARGLIERTIITQALFAAGWLLGAGIVRPPRMDADLARLGGTALTALAAARLIWFDMAVFNPAWADQWVGTLPVFNLILPAYLFSAVWLYAARRRAEAATRSGFWLAAFLAALIVGVALMVRQGFQGAILSGPDMPIAEFYFYSLAGLVVAIGLIVAGMRLPDKALRLAGLLLLTATIVKVFLVDASELKGILRILSFLGLGIALIGIGRLYGPVLRAERDDG